MKFEEILKIIPRVAKELESGKTHNQIAADIEADYAKEPSALNLKPMKERAKRGPNKPKAPPADLMNGHDNHEGTAQ